MSQCGGESVRGGAFAEEAVERVEQDVRAEPARQSDLVDGLEHVEPDRHTTSTPDELATRRHWMSGQSRTAWRTDTKKPMTVMSGAVIDSGSTNVSSGVATTPEPKPATPRTA